MTTCSSTLSALGGTSGSLNARTTLNYNNWWLELDLAPFGSNPIDCGEKALDTAAGTLIGPIPEAVESLASAVGRINRAGYDGTLRLVNVASAAPSTAGVPTMELLTGWSSVTAGTVRNWTATFDRLYITYLQTASLNRGSASTGNIGPVALDATAITECARYLGFNPTHHKWGNGGFWAPVDDLTRWALNTSPGPWGGSDSTIGKGRGFGEASERRNAASAVAVLGGLYVPVWSANGDVLTHVLAAGNQIANTITDLKIGWMAQFIFTAPHAAMVSTIDFTARYYDATGTIHDLPSNEGPQTLTSVLTQTNGVYITVDFQELALSTFTFTPPANARILQGFFSTQTYSIAPEVGSITNGVTSYNRYSYHRPCVPHYQLGGEMVPGLLCRS